MWRTCEGERVLRGSEWELFRAGLGEVWDLVEDSFEGEELFHSGIAAFDSLQPGQKLALLAQAGLALHDETVPPPPLTAHSEGAVAAVYEHIRESVEVEVEAQDVPGLREHAFFWRRRILSACRETDVAGEDPLPDEACEDLSEWRLLLDCLTDRIFWDDDYRMGGQFLDEDPAASRAEMGMLGIAEDYYLALAPDPGESELPALRKTLEGLTGRPRPEEAALVDGFEDGYHGLLVGPCDPGALAAEASCPLVQQVGVPGAEDFDCSYGEWVGLFREAVLRAAAEGKGGHDDPAPTPEQLAAAERAQRAGSPLELPDGNRIEPRPGGWVVLDRLGHVLVEVEACAWSASGDDPGLPPLMFPGAREALLALLRADAAGRARAERREAALRRLGRE